MRQGARELSAAHLFASGVRLAPTLDDRQMFARHCLEELAHVEQVAQRLDDLASIDLLEAASREAAALPTPTTWLEMVVVGTLYDRAVYHQLIAYHSAPDARVVELAKTVIADEQEHLAASQAALADLAAKEPEFAARVARYSETWLPLALACFDPDEAPDCPAGPHTSLEATRRARRDYIERARAVLLPFGVPAALFADPA